LSELIIAPAKAQTRLGRQPSYNHPY